MSHFHTVIAVERRTGDRANSTSMAAQKLIGLDQEGKPVYQAIAAQLHSMGNELNAPQDPNILMAVEWDGIAPYVIAHKGDYSTVTMRYMGWPEITKESYDETHPVSPVL